MRTLHKIVGSLGFSLGVFGIFGGSANAVQLDWGGQFLVENHFVTGYSLLPDNLLPNATFAGAGGYYISGGGQATSSFQTLSLKLKPKLVVNDNLYLKTEFWVGNPAFSFFGDSFPGTSGQRQFYSNQSRGSTITAQRFWLELLTDVGTVHVGRAPLHWGLGLVWNSGDQLKDRFATTADVIRMVSKFGAFTFSPTFAKYSAGNSIAGACTGSPCVPTSGTGSVTEYSLILKYENADEDLEGGVNFIKRLGGAAQEVGSGVFGTDGVEAGMNYNTWDIYGRKKVGPFHFGLEIPISGGTVGGVSYQAFAVAGEIDWQVTSAVETTIKLGSAPGQAGGATMPNSFTAFFFNPNYKLGMIMFNYQLAHFAGANLTNGGRGESSLKSPFDNPIVNANFLNIGGKYRLEKWSFGMNLTFAHAPQSAKDGELFYNTVDHKYYTATGTQGGFIGWEMDYGIGFKWDEHFDFSLDFGWYFPGSHMAFSNTGTALDVGSVFGTVLSAGLKF